MKNESCRLSVVWRVCRPVSSHPPKAWPQPSAFQCWALCQAVPPCTYMSCGLPLLFCFCLMLCWWHVEQEVCSHPQVLSAYRSLWPPCRAGDWPWPHFPRGYLYALSLPPHFPSFFFFFFSRSSGLQTLGFCFLLFIKKTKWSKALCPVCAIGGKTLPSKPS